MNADSGWRPSKHTKYCKWYHTASSTILSSLFIENDLQINLKMITGPWFKNTQCSTESLNFLILVRVGFPWGCAHENTKLAPVHFPDVLTLQWGTLASEESALSLLCAVQCCRHKAAWEDWAIIPGIFPGRRLIIYITDECLIIVSRAMRAVLRAPSDPTEHFQSTDDAPDLGCNFQKHSKISMAYRNAPNLLPATTKKKLFKYCVYISLLCLPKSALKLWLPVLPNETWCVLRPRSVHKSDFTHMNSPQSSVMCKKLFVCPSPRGPWSNLLHLAVSTAGCALPGNHFFVIWCRG